MVVTTGATKEISGAWVGVQGLLHNSHKAKNGRFGDMEGTYGVLDAFLSVILRVGWDICEAEQTRNITHREEFSRADTL